MRWKLVIPQKQILFPLITVNLFNMNSVIKHSYMLQYLDHIESNLGNKFNLWIGNVSYWDCWPPTMILLNNISFTLRFCNTYAENLLRGLKNPEIYENLLLAARIFRAGIT